MEKELKILLIEDNPHDVDLINRELGKLGVAFVLKRVVTEKEFLKSIQEFAPDIILSDYKMPAFDGPRALKLAQENCPSVPFLIVTGSVNEETAVECLKSGASDYVTKEHLIRLASAIQVALEKQKINKELHESDKMFRIITGNVSDLIAILDLEGKRIYNSASYENLFGKRENLKGTDSFSDIHPEDQERIREVFKETIQTGIGKRAEYRFISDDGNVHYVESQGNLIRDVQGNPSKVLVVARDVTERKKTEKEIGILVHAIKSISECVSITDFQNIILFVNDAFLATYGYSRDEIIGKHISILRAMDDATYEAKDILGATQNAGWQGEIVNRKKDGAIFPIHLSTSPVRDDVGKLIALVGIAIDISDRKKVEAEILRSRDFYLKLFEEFPSLIWRAGFNGKRDYANKTMLEFTGRTLEQEIGDGWLKGIHPDDLDYCLPNFFDAFKNRKTLNIEYRLRRNDGTYRWIVDYGRPFHDLDGNFAGFIGSCHDVTAIKEAEEKIRNSETSYRRLFDSVTDAIYIQDKDGYFLDINQGAVNMYGYAREEFIGRTPEFLSAPGMNDLQKTIECVKAALDGIPQRFEWWGRRKNNEIFPKDVRLYKGHYLNQDVVIAIARDITEEKRAETILNELNSELKEKLSALEKFKDVAIDRELKMIELKQKVEYLEKHNK